MIVLRGVEDSKAFAQGLNNSTTARALMVLMERIARLEAVDATRAGEMIEILKRQHFNDAIPANLPPGTPVAHKTGSITKIHHDAAIVLAPTALRARGAHARHRGPQAERGAHGPHRARPVRRSGGGARGSAPLVAGGASPVAALRHRNFRLLWIGQLLSVSGSMMQSAAILWHVALVAPPDHKAIALGLVGLVRVLPIVVFSMLSGVVADVFDRRRVMVLMQTVMAVLAAVLAGLTMRGLDSPWPIYVVAALSSAAGAFDGPARHALIPNLVPRDHLANAISLNTIMFQVAAVAGPSAAGLVVATGRDCRRVLDQRGIVPVRDWGAPHDAGRARQGERNAR